MIPENNLDFSMLNLGGERWSSDNQGFNFFQPQVFAVHSLPEGPVFDAAAFSGKNVDSVSEECKMDAPEFVERPAYATKTKANSPRITFSPEERENPSFALYIDNTSTQSPVKAASTTIEEASRMLENSLSGKASVHFNLISTEATVENVDALFLSLTPSFRRIERLTAHFF